MGSPREAGKEESDKAHKGGLGGIQEGVSRKKLDMKIWGKKRKL